MSYAQPPGTITCPNCGTINPSDLRSCTNCGRLLPRQIYIPPQEPSPQEKRTRGGVKAYSASRRFSMISMFTLSLLMLILGTIIGYLLAISGG